MYTLLISYIVASYVIWYFWLGRSGLAKILLPLAPILVPLFIVIELIKLVRS